MLLPGDPRRVLALAFLTLVGLSQCVRAACLPSPAAVRAVHPGAWPMWSGRLPGHRGERCWFARGETRGSHVESRGGRAGRKFTDARADGAVPLPRPRPDLELEAALRQPRIDPAEGRRLADELLPPAPPVWFREPVEMRLWEMGAR